MRRCIADRGSWVEKGDSTLGISLGYDFCAEHEWGVRPLEEKLGVWDGDPKTESKIFGERRHLVTNSTSISMKEVTTSYIKKENKTKKTEGTLWMLTSAPDLDRLVEQYLTGSSYLLERVFEENEILACWSDSNFLVFSTEKEKMDQLYVAFKTDRILMWPPAGEFFEGKGLTFIDKVKLNIEEPDYSNFLIESQKDYKDLWSEVDKTHIFKKLEKAGCRFYACSPKRLSSESESKLVDIRFWLNPMEQDKYNYGWYTLEELEAWAKGEGPILKESE